MKPFGVAKARLGPVVDREARSRLGKAVAATTIAAMPASEVEVVVITASEAVTAWSRQLGVEVVRERPHLFGSGLDGAAAALVAAAGERPWIVVHADLPLLQTGHMGPVLAALAAGAFAIAPSRTGGTNILAGTGPFPFSYGPLSFHRHLRAIRPRPARVVTSVATALDLDTPGDLAAIRRLSGGGWVEGYLA